MAGAVGSMGGETAERALRPPSRQEYAAEVVRLLASHNETSRIAAVRLLQEAAPDSLSELLRTAQAGARRQALRRAVYRFGCAGSSVFLLCFLWAVALERVDVGIAAEVAFACFLLLAALGEPAPDKVAAALLQLDDPRACGPIAEALDAHDTRWIAEEVLIRLLPRMRASDAALLSDSHRASLYRNLRRGNVRYVLACLQAMQQVGDESAVPPIMRLAEQRGRGAAARQIREAAREALLFMEDRIARERSRRTLLRAAPEPKDRLPRSAEEPIDRLPRPAVEPPDRLLKPLARPRTSHETLVRPHRDE